MSRQINLFNPDFCPQRQPFSAGMLLQGMALLTVAGLLSYGYIGFRVAAQEAQVVALENKLVAQREHLAQLMNDVGQQAGNTLLENEVTRYEAKLRAGQEIADLLQSEVIASPHGFSEYMRAFARQLLDGLWLTGFTITTTEMALNGRLIAADLMPAYLQRLKHEEIMRGRSFASLQIKIPEAETDESAGSIDYLEFSLNSSVLENKQ